MRTDLPAGARGGEAHRGAAAVTAPPAEDDATADRPAVCKMERQPSNQGTKRNGKEDDSEEDGDRDEEQEREVKRFKEEFFLRHCTKTTRVSKEHNDPKQQLFNEHTSLVNNDSSLWSSVTRIGSLVLK